MSNATLKEFPPAPTGKVGWPWTEASEPLPETMPNGKAWPKISIVTPSYNQGQFIEETIRSVLLQGYPNLEYVVVDGGSTDESVEIIQKYAPWIDYWVSEPDRGQSHAINKGLQRCSGEIWNWINSDDLLTKGALRAIGEKMGDSDALIGRTWFLDKQKAELHSTTDFDFINLLKGFDGCLFQQQGVWLKLEQVKECGGIDEAIHHSMDRDLYVRYTYRFSRVKYITEALGVFRIHDSSKTTKAGRHFWQDHIRIAKKTLHSDMWHPHLRTASESCVKRIRWKFFVDDMREGSGKSKMRRFASLAFKMIQNPVARIDRYSMGALKSILMQ